MRFLRRAFAVSTAAVLVFAMVSGGIGYAAKAKAKSRAKAYVRPAGVSLGQGLSKISVPSYILKGSAVATGRAFYKSSVPEFTLGGIRLSRAANTILAKWGNPSRITLGTAQAEVANVPSAPTAPNYIPPGGGYPSLTQGVNLANELLGSGRPALPRLPGYDMPNIPGAPPGQQPQQGGTETRVLRQEEVTWTYDLPNGITLEFIITDGTITQITVGGEGPWGLSKTRTGLQLGDSYKLVLWVMGFPEEHQKYVGRFLRVSYVEKNHVLFTFLNKKLVGVTIALVQEEISQGGGEK